MIWPWGPMAKLIAHRVAGGLAAQTVQDAVGYLSRYGYLAAGVADPDAVAEATRQFRQRFGLVEGDTLDAQAVRAMAWPRCGVPDGRITSEEARWRKTQLTYFVEAYVGGLSRADQDDLIGLAWSDWMAVAGIRVERGQSKASADIVISTGRGRAYNFDGASGTLAWAYLPNGRDTQLLMRFDLDETWVRNATDRGILFRNVACHELGHLLGLDHSSRQTALMAPYYAPRVVSPQPVDDVTRIQSLYGPPVSTPDNPAPVKPEIILRFDGPIPHFECTVKNGN